MAAMRKRSIVVSERTEAFIRGTATSDERPRWSASINAAFDSLRFLISENMPDLSDRDWQIVLNVYFGCYMPDYRYPVKIASDILNNAEVVDIHELTPRIAVLVKRVHAMSQAELIAMQYFIQTFWMNDFNDEPDFKATKEKIMNILR